MIRRILVPLDASPYTGGAVEHASIIAHTHHAVVEGMVVIERFTKSETEEHTRDLTRWFAEECEKRKVPHREAARQGVPAREILDEALTYDLVVTGLRTHFHTRNPDHAGDSLAKILDATTAPILAVPPADEEEETTYDRVLVCYDGSPNASRALREFVRIFHPMDDPEVTILVVGQGEGKGEELANRAEAYLRAHQYNRIEKRVEAGGDISVITEDEFLGRTELIVAGIHAKPIKNFEYLVGSFTRGLISHGRTPLLLAQ